MKKKQFKKMKQIEKKQETWWTRGRKPMKNDEQERTKTRTHCEKERTNKEKWWKEREKTMKNDEQEKKQWNPIKNMEKNSEKWWKIETKTMKNDEA